MNRLFLFLIFCILSSQSEKISASNLFDNARYNEENLKNVSIHLIATDIKILPVVCLQIGKWIKSNGFEEVYSVKIPYDYRITKEQCAQVFKKIVEQKISEEKNKISLLTVNNLSHVQQTDLYVGSELRNRLGEDYPKLMTLPTSPLKMISSSPFKTVNINSIFEPQVTAQTFLKNLEQLLFSSMKNITLNYQRALEEKESMPFKGKEIKTSLYNIWAEANDEKSIPSNNPDETLLISIDTWIQVMDFLINLESTNLLKSADIENQGDTIDEEQINISPKQILSGLLNALSTGKTEDKDLDILCEKAVNICVEKQALPDLKADYMFELYKMQIDDSLDVHIRQYASFFLSELEKHSLFAEDAMKEYQRKVREDQRIKLLKVYGPYWNDYLEWANDFILTKETGKENIFVKKAQTNPLAVLMKKRPNILFQKVAGQSIQEWINLIDYTDHGTIKAFAYLLLNVNVNPKGYVSPNDKYKGAAVEGFYEKIMEKAAYTDHKPFTNSYKSNKDFYGVLGIGNAENLDIWERIPTVMIGKFDPNVFNKNVKVENTKFKLNADNKRNYIDLYNPKHEVKKTKVENTSGTNKPKQILKKEDIANLFKEVTGSELSYEKKGAVSSYDMFFIRFKRLLNMNIDDAKNVLKEAEKDEELNAYK